MNSRSLPFQFRSIDPAKRQAELEKRFGLPTSSEKKMHLDLGNPNWMDMKKEPYSASSSPRLQHRVPVFVENRQAPTQSVADSNPTNVDGGQKPRVRVVPIEVEMGDTPRKGTSSANHGFGVNNGKVKDPWYEVYEPKAEMQPPVFGPRVCNIPVKVEGSSRNGKPKSPATVKKVPVKKERVVKTIPVQREEVPNPVQPNGCNVSTQSKPVQEQVPTSPHGLSLQKIAVVLDKLKGYQADVENFSGTSKEKQYRYLDEMLTRLMLDLDNIETMGNEEVRLSRKDAIRKVQHCIDLLETKVCDGTKENSSQDPSQEMAVELEVGPTEASEVKEADVEADQTMETESQPEADAVSDLEKVGEQTEGLQDIVVTEVEGDEQVEVETEVQPVVSEDSTTNDELVNTSLVKDPEVEITEVDGETSDTQGMDIDEGGLKNVETELEKVSVAVELDSESIPETKVNGEHDNFSSENLSGNC